MRKDPLPTTRPRPVRPRTRRPAAPRDRLVAMALFLGAAVMLATTHPAGTTDVLGFGLAAAVVAATGVLLLLRLVVSRTALGVALAVGLALFLWRITLLAIHGGDPVVVEYTAFRAIVLLTGAAFIVLGPRVGLAMSLVGLVAGVLVVGVVVPGEGTDLGSALRLALYTGVGIVLFQLLSSTIEDVRASAETATEVAELAYLDDLTGLPNRRQMSVLVGASLARTNEGGEADALVMFDLDRFKVVNDTYGHEVGDEVLVRTARIVQTAMREGDVLGRWGGEEFLVVLRGASPAEAVEVADRCRRLLAADPEEPAVTASFGVTTVSPGLAVTDLLRRADLALYRAKQGGRNRVVLADPAARSSTEDDEDDEDPPPDGRGDDPADPPPTGGHRAGSAPSSQSVDPESNRQVTVSSS